jgi:hypothetical protein
MYTPPGLTFLQDSVLRPRSDGGFGASHSIRDQENLAIKMTAATATVVLGMILLTQSLPSGAYR